MDKSIVTVITLVLVLVVIFAMAILTIIHFSNRRPMLQGGAKIDFDSLDNINLEQDAARYRLLSNPEKLYVQLYRNQYSGIQRIITELTNLIHFSPSILPLHNIQRIAIENSMVRCGNYLVNSAKTLNTLLNTWMPIITDLNNEAEDEGGKFKACLDEINRINADTFNATNWVRDCKAEHNDVKGFNDISAYYLIYTEKITNPTFQDAVLYCYKFFASDGFKDMVKKLVEKTDKDLNDAVETVSRIRLPRVRDAFFTYNGIKGNNQTCTINMNDDCTLPSTVVQNGKNIFINYMNSKYTSPIKFLSRPNVGRRTNAKECIANFKTLPPGKDIYVTVFSTPPESNIMPYIKTNDYDGLQTNFDEAASDIIARLDGRIRISSVTYEAEDELVENLDGVSKLFRSSIYIIPSDVEGTYGIVYGDCYIVPTTDDTTGMNKNIYCVKYYLIGLCKGLREIFDREGYVTALEFDFIKIDIFSATDGNLLFIRERLSRSIWMLKDNCLYQHANVRRVPIGKNVYINTNAIKFGDDELSYYNIFEDGVEHSKSAIPIKFKKYVSLDSKFGVRIIVGVITDYDSVLLFNSYHYDNMSKFNEYKTILRAARFGEVYANEADFRNRKELHMFTAPEDGDVMDNGGINRLPIVESIDTNNFDVINPLRGIHVTNGQFHRANKSLLNRFHTLDTSINPPNAFNYVTSEDDTNAINNVYRTPDRSVANNEFTGTDYRVYTPMTREEREQQRKNITKYRLRQERMRRYEAKRKAIRERTETILRMYATPRFLAPRGRTDILDSYGKFDNKDTNALEPEVDTTEYGIHTNDDFVIDGTNDDVGMVNLNYKHYERILSKD